MKHLTQGHKTVIHAPVITGSGGEARFWFAGKLISDVIVIVVVVHFTVVLSSETDADWEF